MPGKPRAGAETVYVTKIDIMQPKPSESRQSHFSAAGCVNCATGCIRISINTPGPARTTGATRPAGSLRPHCACCHHPGAADHVRRKFRRLSDARVIGRYWPAGTGRLFICPTRQLAFNMMMLRTHCDADRIEREVRPEKVTINPKNTVKSGVIATSCHPVPPPCLGLATSCRLRLGTRPPTRWVKSAEKPCGPSDNG
jgi:hypothetical protein